MAAPLYRSRTRSITLPELSEPLRAALEAHASQRQVVLGDMRAWLTHRENPVADGMLGKLFGRRSNSADADAEHDMVLVLQATQLLVGTSGAVRGTSFLSLPLVQASVTRGSALGAMAMAGGLDVPSDDGLSIAGFPGTVGRPGTYFFALDGSAEADACVAAVTAAITAAKR